ncbi:MAG TPA: hypothetical protein VME21_10535 [Steroidobacteraceae bacterium]|nr:hypothetical protein [Steroidobacteraceae bacterium]
MSMLTRIIRRQGMALATAAALLGAAALLPQSARAGCLDYKAPKAVSWQTPAEYFGSLRIVRISTQEGASDEDAWSWEWDARRAPIVGLWAFRYYSKGNLTTLGIPDGTVLDGGNTLWYADGNENTVSGVRAPATGDVCLGIWKRTGESTYELNHIGLSWDPVHNVPAGPAFIKQYVTLSSDKNSYKGTFTIRQLDPDGKTLSTPAPITGTIVATRVTINTDTQESLP